MKHRLIDSWRGCVGVLRAAGVQRVTVSAESVILLVLDCGV